MTTSNPERRDLVLGAATGYAAEAVRPFLQSLAQSGFGGHLVLFAHARELPALRALVQACAPKLSLDLVRVRSIREHAKLTRSLIKRLTALAPSERYPWLKQRLLDFQGKPHVARYLRYRAYLQAHPEFSRILLTDVRDVIFQSDPFAELELGLHVGMESPAMSIATEIYDRDWIVDAYGQAMLEQLGDCQVSCSGVTLGDREVLEHYLDRMLTEILRQPFRKMKTRIYDQAFHNKLLHGGELGFCHRCQPLRSRIATVGCLPDADFALSPEGYLLNADGRPAPIVHQYDRHPRLVSAFDARIKVRT